MGRKGTVEKGSVGGQVSVSEAKREFSDLCNRAGYGRETIILTKRGKALAAIVSVQDLEHYMALEDEHASRILEQAVATSRGVEKVTPL
jgi:prevent-host-death family protein